MGEPAVEKTFLQRHGTGLLLLAAVTGLLVAMQAGVFSRPNPMLGKHAPDFTLATADGKDMALSRHRGQDVVVLDFFATWCPPCRESLPHLDAMAKEFAGKGVAFYAVNVGESAEIVKAYFAEAGLGLATALDEAGEAAEKYGVSGIPQQVIIGKDGVVELVNVGFGMGSETTLRRAIEALLRGETLAERPETGV